MNFLAHLYLSGDNEPLIVGNFLGDFLSNKEVAALPEPIREGIALHRRIDSFTDTHEMVRQSARRLRASHGKYAPVILDVLHDYLLANHWSRYSDKPIGEFATKVYAVLQRHLDLMPAYLQQRLPLMIADDWLVRYGTEDGLMFTFSRMQGRSSYPAFFDNAVESLKKDQPLYEAEFHVFFPELIEYTSKSWLSNP